MNIGLITIGAELLNGTRTDTNAAWIGNAVGSVGGTIVWHMTVNDGENSIKSALKTVPNNINTVLCTGGLGPTHDDVTQNVLYEYFDVKAEFDKIYWELLKEKFAARGKKIPESNRNQAMKPNKGELIANPVGSARGLHFSNDHYHLFALPGVPVEMKTMMKKTVLPWIQERSENQLFTKTLRTTGIMESVLFERLEPILENHRNVRVGFLPKFTGVDIKLSSVSEIDLNIFIDKVVPMIHKYHFGNEEVELEDALGTILIEKEKTISTAESCTGGLAGDRLTNIPGSSTFYKGGIVAYSNEIKMSVLNVQESTLKKNGAVSEKTALEMAHGVRKIFGTDIGVSTTGIAGPTGGTNEKPVGLVFVGISAMDYEKVYKFTFTPYRKINKLMTSQSALNIVRLYLLNEL